MNRSDGGPAFPVTPFSADARNWSDGSEGMTLRDYFAAKALQGFWSAPDEPIPSEQTREQFRKEMCGLFYEWADAMLAARTE